jgi:prepilin-type N-terminal cleavage/methylation domain-containing protein
MSGKTGLTARRLSAMNVSRSEGGFTILEMVCAVAIIGVLVAIYFFLIDSYRERRMSEQAARVLMLAAKAEEDFLAKHYYYFDAEVSGNSEDVFLSTPEGKPTTVLVPSKVTLSLKARGKDKTAFTGHAFYSGSKILHRYDSEAGKMTTVSRGQDEAG